MRQLAKLICGMAAIALLAGCANDYHHRDNDRDHRGGPPQDSGDHRGGGDHNGPR